MTIQLEKVMYIQEKILGIKRIRDALQPSSDQEVVSVKSQLTYNCDQICEKGSYTCLRFCNFNEA